MRSPGSTCGQPRRQLAADMDARRADTADRPEVVLLSARHPGLTGRVVPIDIRLGDGYTALVVTGPNTGGKTVTLRTLGLLSLMHQAGLHIPAERRQPAAGLARRVRRHRRRAVGRPIALDVLGPPAIDHRIVAAAGPGTLVLLDELGAGTDPTEGSALAQALLDHFIRAGALVAATTHYAELKAYAHTTPGARIAARVASNERCASVRRERASATIGCGQAEPLGDRERLAAARQADRQPVGRATASRGRTRPAALRAPGVVWA